MAESYMWQKCWVHVGREPWEVRGAWAQSLLCQVEESGFFSVGSMVRGPGQRAGMPMGCSLW